MTLDFSDAVVPDDVSELDTAPPRSDVEYPCVVCNEEAGPYGGRGPKPKYCPKHKKGAAKRSTVNKVGGAVATQAAQATAVLVQVNGMLAMGMMALGLNGSASRLAEANDVFEQQAYNALVTDAALCQLILKGGVKSAKLSLGIAYAGLGAAVLPTAIEELKEKKAERDARKQAEEDAAGA